MATEHHMRLVRQYGRVSEWTCDTCGRCIVVQYQQIVKVTGNERVAHHANANPPKQQNQPNQQLVETPPSGFKKWFSR